MLIFSKLHFGIWYLLSSNRREGHQPITEGHQSITEGHQPITGGHQSITEGHQPITGHSQLQKCVKSP